MYQYWLGILYTALPFFIFKITDCTIIWLEYNHNVYLNPSLSSSSTVFYLKTNNYLLVVNSEDLRTTWRRRRYANRTTISRPRGHCFYPKLPALQHIQSVDRALLPPPPPSASLSISLICLPIMNTIHRVICPFPPALFSRRDFFFITFSSPTRPVL